MHLTPLQSKVTREILLYVRRKNLAVGTHLIESGLAKELNTSRSPVKFSLNFLKEKGVVSYDKNRGFFLSTSPMEMSNVSELISDINADPVYQKIVRLRIVNKLPEIFTEIDLMREFNVSRTVLRNVLTRIQQEGWLEFRTGQGWRILPVIDSLEAYRESFSLRIMIEPAGLFSDSFHIDRNHLEDLRSQQAFIYEEGYITMTSLELFEANSQFHETLALHSGNRFILQTIKRINQLRRLIEYRQSDAERPLRSKSSGEHVDILNLLLKGDNFGAANLLRLHLEKAKNDKVQADYFNEFSSY